MKSMTEKELREINPEDFEGKDIAWSNDGKKFTGLVLFDYDQGLSVLEKNNTERCLVGIHGPAYTGEYNNYDTKSEYHGDLTAAFSMLKDNFYDVPTRKKLCGIPTDLCFGGAKCSFT